MSEDTKISYLFEDLVGYIAKNEVQRSIKPVFKTEDFALYNDIS